MRHDIASHLYTIEVLLKQEKYLEAETYSQEIKAANQFQSQLGNCQNPVVDAYLYSRISELEEQGISVQATVELPNLPDISDVDLIIALGNLLDNARDASQCCEQPEIVLHIYCRNGRVFLSTLNTAPPKQNKKQRRIPELERGVGFNILRELAEKYHGTFTYTRISDQFKVIIALKGGVYNAFDSHL